MSLRLSPNVSSGSTHQHLESRFGYKYCTQFVLQTEHTKDDTNSRCICGELKVNHSDSVCEIEHGGEDWSPSSIVYVQPTNAHGTINFQEAGMDLEQTAQYIRISDTDSPEDVLNYLCQKWNFLEPKRPRMCISIACEPTDVRIVESNKQKIFEGTQDPVNYNCQAVDDSGLMCTLSPDYSNFLLIDDGFRYDHEHKTFEEFVARIEQRMSLPTLEGGLAIPTVLVVIGGDHATLGAVAARIKIGIPVVILKGSGGICDIMETLMSFCRQNRM
nr:unnamed protein product [Spirometra erinaceieuropaei]